MSDNKSPNEIQAPRRRGCVRGSGTLNPAEEARALDMVRASTVQRLVAEAFGVTKNTIAGLWSRHGEPIKNENIAPTTLDERLDALNAKLDRVLAETRGIGILAPVPPHGPKARRR